jgi:AcrR family transcriptional regulator
MPHSDRSPKDPLKPSPDPEDRPRDRSRTEESILKAARTVLVDKGFGGWGVNAIARAAGCDKQLIYRYYGGMDGLAEALGEEIARDIVDALAKVPKPQVATYGELVAALIDAQLHVLRAHPLMQRIVAWELSEANDLTRSFAAARSQALLSWFTKVKGNIPTPQGIDAPAINAVMIAAVQQMVLSSGTIGGFAGMSLTVPADWERLRAIIRRLILAAYDGPGSPTAA